MKTYTSLFLLVAFAFTSLVHANEQLQNDILNKGPFIYKKKVTRVSRKVKDENGEVKLDEKGNPIYTSFDRLSTAGRHIYTGDVPRIEAHNIELYASKMALTLRVKAWISKTTMNNYAKTLWARFNKIKVAFDYEKLHLDPLVSIEAMKSSAKTKDLQAWYTVAAQYSKHNLEDRDVNIYDETVDSAEYKNKILTAILRSYFLDNTLTLDKTDAIASKIESEQYAKELFEKHLGAIYMPDLSKNEDTLGYITLVYPIGAHSAGPFGQPAEQFVKFGMTTGMSVSRIDSEKWDDEFGGFPFLQVLGDGVAFHGPISKREDASAWYLTRDYVSHGCMRMDSSDVIEFRQLLPANVEKLLANKQGIPLQIMEWFDVDTSENGEANVSDIAYYYIPHSVKVGKDQTIEVAAQDWLLPNAQTRFWRQAKWNKYNLAAKQPNFSFDASTNTFTNIPRYIIENGKLKRDGVFEKATIKTYPYRGNRIIQYFEEGVKPYGFADIAGKFPPKYFYGQD